MKGNHVIYILLSLFDKDIEYDVLHMTSTSLIKYPKTNLDLFRQCFTNHVCSVICTYITTVRKAMGIARQFVKYFRNGLAVSEKKELNLPSCHLQRAMVPRRHNYPPFCWS